MTYVGMLMLLQNADSFNLVVASSDFNMPDWSRIPVNLTSDTIFFSACILGALVFAWWLGWSWPWQRAERMALVHDIERANIELGGAALQRRLKLAEEKLGREVVMSDIAKRGLKAQVDLLEKRISELRKELDEAKAMGFVSASGLGAGVGVEVGDPSTIQKRIPSSS
jgi:hypothetical protein